MLFLACKLSSCRSVLVALAQLEVADNSSSTHTTTTPQQLVSQGKDPVIGLSLVALVVLAQRGKKRSVQCNSFCFVKSRRIESCPDDVMAHPCQRHQRWPQERGHCLCPLLQRNLRLNRVARRRRDSSLREKKCCCNYDTHLSLHIMKWFDAMCEEPFAAVAKSASVFLNIRKQMRTATAPFVSCGTHG